MYNTIEYLKFYSLGNIAVTTISRQAKQFHDFVPQYPEYVLCLS